jgi:hypothetical protein
MELIWPDDGLAAMRAEIPSGLKGPERLRFVNRRSALINVHAILFPEDTDGIS